MFPGSIAETPHFGSFQLHEPRQPVRRLKLDVISWNVLVDAMAKAERWQMLRHGGHGWGCMKRGGF